MGALIDGWAGRSEVLRFDERDRGGFEHLLVTAVRVGSARRANDLGALRNAQEVILHAVMQPPDLLAIPVHGELMVAAARLGEIERVDEARARRDERFPADARSPLLELGCVWIDLQIASAVEGVSGGAGVSGTGVSGAGVSGAGVSSAADAAATADASATSSWVGVHGRGLTLAGEGPAYTRVASRLSAAS